MKPTMYSTKQSLFLFCTLLIALLSHNTLIGQCFVENISPFSFSASGGTQNNSIVYTNGSCTYSLTFSNIPSWITSVTQPNSYQVVVTCQSNSGGSRNALINYSYNGQMQSFSVTQAANPNPPPAPNNPTIVSNSNGCGEATLQRSGNPPSGVTWYWQGTDPSGTNSSAALNASTNTYSATQSGTYYIRARGSNGVWSTSSGSRSVSIINLSAGIVMDVPSICYGGDPNLIDSFEEASGSNGNHTYQWEWATSPTSSSWNTIANATGSTYNPPGGLQSSRSYRRVARCGTKTENSNIVTVVVNAPLEGGTINSPSPICSGENSATLLGTSASNGDGTYGYQWEWASVGSSSWNSISGATSSQYTPPALTESRKYRRKVVSCGQTAESNEVTQVVHPILGTALGPNVSRCSTGPVTLTATPGTNADQVKWYTSSTGGTEITAGVSANTLSLTTSSLSSSTTYYIESYNSSNGCAATSRAAIQAQIEPAVTWYLDADGDGHAISTVQDCTSPGANYTQTALPLDDCDDGTYDLSNICFDGGLTTVTLNQSGHNYVYTRQYQDSTGSASAFFTPDADLIQNITYFDGLGRSSQQIGLEQTPEVAGVKRDIVTHIGYDGFGRQEKEWLPYAEDMGTYGAPKTAAETATNTYYIQNYGQDILTGAPNPYSQKAFEPSPLNRVLQQAAPGNDWALGQGHEIEFAYQTNTHDPNNVNDANNDNVRLFAVTLSFADNTYTPSLANQGYYLAGELYKTVTYDENHTSGKNHSTEEFTDKQGRVVLKRTYADIDLNSDGDTNDTDEEAEAPHDTYYVYDDHGNLTYVLPPLVDTGATVNQTVLNNLGYQYVYDHRNRLVEKRIPGKEVEYIVYNKLDQPIMTQDANQRATGEWLFTKYDAFGRVAYTGKAIKMDGASPTSRTDVQDAANAVSGNLWVQRSSGFSMDDMLVEYGNNAYPLAAEVTEVLTINYYDDYGFDPQDEPTPPTTVFNDSVTTNVKGLPTGGKVKVLDPNAGAGQKTWITTITRYDAKGRAIYTYSQNDFLQTVDVVETEL
ncbi:MAG: DUF6443 domain-containing protein, partial [Bacteroidota bacterium]